MLSEYKRRVDAGEELPELLPAAVGEGKGEDELYERVRGELLEAGASLA